MENAVILCTTALFLSGYTIQQRTLRELRAAIRPRESPKVHLPDRFKTSTTELKDGTVIFVESEAELETKEQQISIVEVKQSEPEAEKAPEKIEPAAVPSEKEESKKSTKSATEKQVAMVEKLKAKVAEKTWAVENPDPLSKNRVPITRAQRRQQIKDELRRLSQSEKPIYYQRRLW